MKQANYILITILSTLTGIIFACLSTFLFLAESVHTYKVNAEVTEITSTEVALMDDYGNLWSCSIEGVVVGQELTVTLSTNKTLETNLDDVIKKIEPKKIIAIGIE